MTKYTIAVCNYNMADTIEEALRSVLDQVTDEFEVLVVDGGSSDGSVKILQTLEKEYNVLRVITLEEDKSRTLGEQRDISVRRANGEYVLLHIDTDDYYDEIILDFIKLYHQLEAKLSFELALVGCHITMLRRDFLLEIGSYRHLHYGEDNDLWRRLMAQDALIWIDCKHMFEELGYRKRLYGRMKRGFRMQIANFRSGISYREFINYTLSSKSLPTQIFNLVTSPVSYTIASKRKQYSNPIELAKADKERRDRTLSITEIEKRYDIHIDRDIFSDKGMVMLNMNT